MIIERVFGTPDGSRFHSPAKLGSCPGPRFGRPEAAPEATVQPSADLNPLLTPRQPLPNFCAQRLSTLPPNLYSGVFIEYMANTILVGAQWGDEGKGKIIDVLTEQADLV